MPPLTAPRLLFTIVTLWIVVVPPIVDMTPTHAHHPDWPGHARFHMVWLLGVNSSVGLLALYLLWAPSPNARARLRLAGLLDLIILGAFFLAAFTMGAYGGTLSDSEGGVRPLPGGFDANFVAFGVLLILVLVGFVRDRGGDGS